MKALTIWQPWASLIVAGAKPYEFRSYCAARAFVGKRIVIHAGARKAQPNEIRELLVKLRRGDRRGASRLDWGTALDPDIAGPLLERASMSPGMLPLACGLGTATLGPPDLAVNLFGHDQRPADSDRLDHSMWGWPLQNVERWEPVVPMKGAQGFWEWPS